MRPFSPAINERVKYLSIACGEWDAIVRGIGLPGRYDIEVTGPGIKEPLWFRAIRVSTGSSVPGLRPWPQEAA